MAEILMVAKNFNVAQLAGKQKESLLDCVRSMESDAPVDVTAIDFPNRFVLQAGEVIRSVMWDGEAGEFVTVPSVMDDVADDDSGKLEEIAEQEIEVPEEQAKKVVETIEPGKLTVLSDDELVILWAGLTDWEKKVARERLRMLLKSYGEVKKAGKHEKQNVS